MDTNDDCAKGPRRVTARHTLARIAVSRCPESEQTGRVERLCCSILRVTQALLLAQVAFTTGCAAPGQEPARNIVAPASAASPAVEADPSIESPDPLPALPEAPKTTPSPWVPYAIEKAMGATCDTIDSYESQSLQWPPRDEFFPAGGCEGLLPAHLKRLLLAVPEVGGETLHQRARLFDEPGFYLAVPGLGVRPDFVARRRSWVIRTFEGPDAAVTVIAVWGPECPHNDQSLCAPRFYRVAASEAVEVGVGDIWPGAPVISDQQADYLSNYGPTEPHLRFNRLAYAPTFRWEMEFDPTFMPPRNAPLPKGWATGHMGFVVWNGLRFELKTAVSRRFWPCIPVYRDNKPCSDVYNEYPLEFVTP